MNTMSNIEYDAFRNASKISKMYIVQRCSFRENIVADRNINHTVTGHTGILSMDYMGSAEYEYGAIPCSFRRIMDQFDQYQLFNSDIVNCNGVPLSIFCKSSAYNHVLAELHLYLDEMKIRDKIWQYRLKESIGFSDQVFGINKKTHPHSCFSYGDNCWWDLRNDFIFFFGAADRIRAFNNAFNTDFIGWWQPMDNNQRDKLIKEAYHHRY